MKNINLNFNLTDELASDLEGRAAACGRSLQHYLADQLANGIDEALRRRSAGDTELTSRQVPSGTYAALKGEAVA